MAPALVHFLVGASLALLLATPIALRYRLAPWWPVWLVAIGGLWGLGPDVHHIMPIYAAELHALHGSPWMDLFAGHYTLDRPVVSARDTASIFGALLCFLGAVSTLTLAGQIRTRTTVAETAVPQLVALAVALSSLLVVIAATGGGLPELVSWIGDHVAIPGSQVRELQFRPQ